MVIKYNIKRKYITLAAALLSIVIANSCKTVLEDLNEPVPVRHERTIETTASSPCNEVVLFLGNRAVGKSTLCNSIFQKLVFSSGTNTEKGTTIQQQNHIYEGRIYIDTPGLDDIELSLQLAGEIEKALKNQALKSHENYGYKIIFVATIAMGKIRPADLVTINTICEAIKTPFEYGIIFNKVTNPIIRKINQSGIELYLTALSKKPTITMLLKKASELEDEIDTYFPSDTENREKLVEFITNLPANKFDEDITGFDAKNLETRVKYLEQKHKKEINLLQKTLGTQEVKIEKLTTLSDQLQQIGQSQVQTINSLTNQLAQAREYQTQQTSVLTQTFGLMHRLYLKEYESKRKGSSYNSDLGGPGKYSIIHEAAALGYTETVQFLLDNDLKNQPATVSDKDERISESLNGWSSDRLSDRSERLYGYTPIHWAAKHGHEATVQFLLARNASVNERTNEGAVALHKAARGGHETTVKLLLKEKANLNEKDNDGYTPLHEATQGGYLPTIKLLLDNKANVNEQTYKQASRDNKGRTALELISDISRYSPLDVNVKKIEIVHLLLQHKADINSLPSDIRKVIEQTKYKIIESNQY
jgi:energy-coupling factor transporter ATP-binding protein EcfA2